MLKWDDILFLAADISVQWFNETKANSIIYKYVLKIVLWPTHLDVGVGYINAIESTHYRVTGNHIS